MCQLVVIINASDRVTAAFEILDLINGYTCHITSRDG